MRFKDENEVNMFLEEVLAPKDGELRQFPAKPLMSTARWAIEIHLRNLTNYWGYESIREYVKDYFGLIEPTIDFKKMF